MIELPFLTILEINQRNFIQRTLETSPTARMRFDTFIPSIIHHPSTITNSHPPDDLQHEQHNVYQGQVPFCADSNRTQLTSLIRTQTYQHIHLLCFDLLSKLKPIFSGTLVTACKPSGEMGIGTLQLYLRSLDQGTMLSSTWSMMKPQKFRMPQYGSLGVS